MFDRQKNLLQAHAAELLASGIFQNMLFSS